MKSRDDIEKQVDTVWKRNPNITYQYLILEMLLDIRELLQSATLKKVWEEGDEIFL